MKKTVMIKPTNQVREAQAFIDEWVNKPIHGMEPRKEENKSQQATSPTVDKEPEDPLFRFTFMIPTYLHRRIKKTCAVEGMSIKDKLTGILLEHFPET